VTGQNLLENSPLHLHIFLHTSTFCFYKYFIMSNLQLSERDLKFVGRRVVGVRVPLRAPDCKSPWNALTTRQEIGPSSGLIPIAPVETVSRGLICGRHQSECRNHVLVFLVHPEEFQVTEILRIPTQEFPSPASPCQWVLRMPVRSAISVSQLALPNASYESPAGYYRRVPARRGRLRLSAAQRRRRCQIGR
jgi:hypothetical protein